MKKQLHLTLSLAFTILFFLPTYSQEFGIQLYSLRDYFRTDIENSLKILNPNGYIVCHDMSPEREEMQIIPMATALFLDSRVSNWGWTGDCWRAWVYFRSNHQDLSMFVVDTDYGCGVITRGSQTLINQESQELTFENFDNNRKEWLNLISAESFNQMIG